MGSGVFNTLAQVDSTSFHHLNNYLVLFSRASKTNKRREHSAGGPSQVLYCGFSLVPCWGGSALLMWTICHVGTTCKWPCLDVATLFLPQLHCHCWKLSRHAASTHTVQLWNLATAAAPGHLPLAAVASDMAASPPQHAMWLKSLCKVREHR
jgi:hypothetical protein